MKRSGTVVHCMGLLYPIRLPISRVIDAIVHGHLSQLEWVDALQAANVEVILLRVRATLVMRIDAAL